MTVTGLGAVLAVIVGMISPARDRSRSPRRFRLLVYD